MSKESTIVQFICKNHTQALLKGVYPTLKKSSMLVVPILEHYFSEDNRLHFLSMVDNHERRQSTLCIMYYNHAPINVEILIIPRHDIKYLIIKSFIEGYFLIEHYFPEEATYKDDNRYIEICKSIFRAFCRF